MAAEEKLRREIDMCFPFTCSDDAPTATVMELPNKRLKMSPLAGEEADFVPLGGDEGTANGDRYGFAAAEEADASIAAAPKGPRAQQGAGHFTRNAWNDPRNAKDRPKSKHILPGHEPWILVRTKYGRRFAHNTQTKESLWRIPNDVFQAVCEFERAEREHGEKERNAAWAEQQLQEMQTSSKAEQVNRNADEEERGRRRRSESVQKEDEEAMMAELAADAEHKEEQDAKNAVKAVEEKERPWRGAYDSGSDSDYEEVEVTDSEGEEDGEGEARQEADEQQEEQDDGPVEFGEDDIAYQLAAMGEEYGLDQGEYGSPGEEEEWEEGAEGMPVSDEDAAALFRDMLDDHQISPFTPWDRLIADESEDGILMDDRYTVLPNMRTRKDVWESWVKDTAARLKEERAKMEKQDPRIPYLAFLSDHATPKLYWPEFKRKYKKDALMNDRKFSEKDREKLYREHINRLKLPESTRKADLTNLLKSIPVRDLNNRTTLDSLPKQLLSNLHFISLPQSTRNNILLKHISSLPPPPSEAEDGEVSEEQRAEEERKRAERQRREDALAERERKVDEERRKAEKEGRWARRDLREEERELQRAMKLGRSGIVGQLGKG